MAAENLSPTCHLEEHILFLQVDFIKLPYVRVRARAAVHGLFFPPHH